MQFSRNFRAALIGLRLHDVAFAGPAPDRPAPAAVGQRFQDAVRALWPAAQRAAIYEQMERASAFAAMAARRRIVPDLMPIAGLEGIAFLPPSDWRRIVAGTPGGAAVAGRLRCELVARLRCGDLRALGRRRPDDLWEWLPRRLWRHGAHLEITRQRVEADAVCLRGGGGVWRDLRIIEAAEYLRQAAADAAPLVPDPDLSQAVVVLPARRRGYLSFSHAAASDWLAAAMRADRHATKAALCEQVRAKFAGLSGRQAEGIWSELVKRDEFANLKHPGRKPKKIKQGND